MNLDFKKTGLISSEFILNNISEYKIFSYYLGEEFEIGKLLNSPFRNDNNPSFGIYLDKYSGRLRYKDFGDINIKGTCFDFVSTLFNISFNQSVYKIYNDLILNNNGNESNNNMLSINNNSNSIYIEGQTRSQKIISIKSQPFTYMDYIYWNQYGIDINLLVNYDIFSCRCIYIDYKLSMEYTNNNPIYAFKQDNYYKIYKPLEKNKKFKWFNNIRGEYYQGFDQLDYIGDLLIITKSMKDVLVLRSLGYNSIAPPSEGYNIPEETIYKLQKRFERIIIFYDNDTTGIRTSNELSIKYNLQNIRIVENILNIKDISDYRKEFGREKTKEFLNGII